jgi:serine/threonine protein kinase
VIHGDLTGVCDGTPAYLCTHVSIQANILIDGVGKARLVDFGLSTIKAEFEGTSYDSSTVGGALRWRAPELLAVCEDDIACNLSAACDIYSYGSVMLQVCTMMKFMLCFSINPHPLQQVLSGKLPYHNLSEFGVFHAVFNGIRPQHPSNPWVTDAHWKFIHHCWDSAPDARPCINEVSDRVAAFRHDYIDITSSIGQRPVPKPFPFAKRHLRYVTLSTDGYETDSESRHSSPKTKSYLCLSEQEDNTLHCQSANRELVTRPR